ncbi:MAG TPA: hypothetical protein VFX53_08675 [Pedococcus sp.]|nr:hypothetical protein [Pedococcus sp.]
MQGDPAELRRLAGALRLQADRVRLQAVWVRALGAVRWRSPAAEVFRGRARARGAALEAAAEDAWAVAGRLEHLAVLLEQEP